MIFKELDPFTPSDKFRNAGRAAEEKAAFYLKRFFEDEEKILILNGIRLETQDDAAQVDHLVIYENGLIIIESKSTAGKIKLKDDGQWVRWYNDKSTGMESPIVQAQAQRIFFKKAMTQATKQPNLFDTVSFEILIAISDNGEFLEPQKSKRPKEVCKADQLPEKINAIIEERKSNKPRFTKEEIVKIADFFKKSHKPITIKTASLALENPEPPPKVEEPKAIYQSKNNCSKCGKEVDKKVVTYCLRFHKKEFAGKVYCQDCQKTISK